jgi:elongator complex protein 3
MIEEDDNKDEPNKVLAKAVREIAYAIIEGSMEDRESLQSLKLRVSRKFKLSRIPANSAILSHLRELNCEIDASTLDLLIKKPSRTLSGVAVVAVMTSPHDCPHGRCSYCPGGTAKEIPTPQSYTGREPAAMRAAMNDYDPFRQTSNRLKQLEEIGHPTDKVDLILMGGTLTARDREYQEFFVKGCLDAMNGTVSKTVCEAQLLNETSRHRCIGMTFETRPDHFGPDQCGTVLELGGTRVELGVQSAFDEPLDFCSRGHGTAESIEATRIAKDSGLKVGYHIMPGLPGSTKEMDIESARRIFEDPGYRPDMIKIYPTLVVKGTELYDLWRKGEYHPLTTVEAAEIVAEIKRITPPWIRIQRVQRDIPTPVIEAGVEKSNLRQVAGELMKQRGWRCSCIRCREIGHREHDKVEDVSIEDFHLINRTYRASGGSEHFISMENEETDLLLGFVRLREPSEQSAIHADGGAFVRELKVFGKMASLGKRNLGTWQHKGTGRMLLAEAEETAREKLGKKKLLITSGIGVRQYYRNLGYIREGHYMMKRLK